MIAKLWSMIAGGSTVCAGSRIKTDFGYGTVASCGVTVDLDEGTKLRGIGRPRVNITVPVNKIKV